MLPTPITQNLSMFVEVQRKNEQEKYKMFNKQKNYKY